jgi:polysaccharide biosynthesis/export protein
MHHVTLRWILVGLATTGCWLEVPEARAQDQSKKENGNTKGSAAVSAPSVDSYRIGPEDVLDISVWNNTAISRVVPVRPDGKISLPLLADVQAAGLTPAELRDVLDRMLVTYMATPEVSVIVREVHSFKVSVLGQVKTPGRYELRNRATVLDVLALAGGFNDFANKSRILILRQDGRILRRFSFNYGGLVSGEDTRQDLFLQPGDVVVVL